MFEAQTKNKTYSWLHCVVWEYMAPHPHKRNKTDFPQSQFNKKQKQMLKPQESIKRLYKHQALTFREQGKGIAKKTVGLFSGYVICFQFYWDS
jgi:hypothetical protein